MQIELFWLQDLGVYSLPSSCICSRCSSAFASSAISISFVVVSSPLRACVNTPSISAVVHVVSFDVRATRFARVTSHFTEYHLLISPLRLSWTHFILLRFLSLSPRFHYTILRLDLYFIVKSRNPTMPRATLDSTTSRLPFISWVHLIYSPRSRNMHPR